MFGTAMHKFSSWRQQRFRPTTRSDWHKPLINLESRQSIFSVNPLVQIGFNIQSRQQWERVWRLSLWTSLRAISCPYERLYSSSGHWIQERSTWMQMDHPGKLLTWYETNIAGSDIGNLSTLIWCFWKEWLKLGCRKLARTCVSVNLRRDWASHMVWPPRATG